MMWSGIAPFNSMSRPSPGRNHPRNGKRIVPTSMIGAAPVLMTPPAVGTPTSRPRLSVLIAWLKISAFEKLFCFSLPLCESPDG